MASKRQEIPHRTTGLLKVAYRGDANYTFVRATYEPGGTFGWKQPAFQLVVLLHGHANIQIDGDSVHLEEGESILMQPGWEIAYRFSQTERTIHTACQLESVLLQKEEVEWLQKVRGVHPTPAAVHILIGEGMNSPVLAGDQLHASSACIAKACLLRFAADVSESSKAGNPTHPSLARALEALEAEPTKFKKAGFLAAQCGISVSRLRQLFQEAGNESPSAMIWRVKTEHAIQMIRSTGLTLGEIAVRSGFANAFHLSRSVKKHTGVSPKGMRTREFAPRPNGSRLQ